MPVKRILGRTVHCKRDRYDVLIDRTTRWGNPYKMSGEHDRDLVLMYFWVGLQHSQDSRFVWMREHIHQLEGKTLGCWCAPRKCHGDLLLEYLREVKDGSRKRS